MARVLGRSAARRTLISAAAAAFDDALAPVAVGSLYARLQRTRLLVQKPASAGARDDGDGLSDAERRLDALSSHSRLREDDADTSTQKPSGGRPLPAEGWDELDTAATPSAYGPVPLLPLRSQLRVLGWDLAVRPAAIALACCPA